MDSYYQEAEMMEMSPEESYWDDTSAACAMPPFQDIGPRAGLVDWLLALYLVTVAALQATAIYKYSTYLAYIVFAAFAVSLFFTASTNRSYGQVLSMPGFWLLVCFIMWGFGVIPFVEDRLRLVALVGARYVTQIHVVALVFIMRCDSFSKFFLYLKAIIVGAFVMALSGAVLGYSVAAGSSGSQLGLATHENAFGIALYVGLIASLILFPMANRRWKILIWVYFAGAFMSLLISASRGATVAFFLAVLAYFVLEHLRHLKSNLKLVIPAIVVIILVPVVAVKYFPYSPLVLKMTRLFYGDPEATSGRLEIYEHAWSMFLSNPIKGWGLGTYRAHSQFSYTHTTFLEILVALGVLGFIFYYGFYFYTWIVLSRLKKIYETDNAMRKLLNACRAVLLAVAAYGAFTVVIYQKGTTFIIACMLGMAFRLYRQLKQHQIYQ